MRPSPAIVVAVLALVAALAGTAVAGPGAESAGKAGKALKQAKKAKRKAKKALRASRDNSSAISEIGLTPGPKGEKGDKGEPGEKGDTGATGATGTARAYGRVSDSGALSRGKAIDGVRRPFLNGYCIDPAAGIDPNSSILVVSVDSDDSTTSTSQNIVNTVQWDSSREFCNSNEFEVETFEAAEIDQAGDDTMDVIPRDLSFSFVVP